MPRQLLEPLNDHLRTVGRERRPFDECLVGIITLVPERYEVMTAREEAVIRRQSSANRSRVPAHMSHNSLASISPSKPFVTTSGKGFLGVGSGLVFFLTLRWITLPSIVTRFRFLFLSRSSSPLPFSLEAAA